MAPAPVLLACAISISLVPIAIPAAVGLPVMARAPLVSPITGLSAAPPALAARLIVWPPPPARVTEPATLTVLAFVPRAGVEPAVTLAPGPATGTALATALVLVSARLGLLVPTVNSVTPTIFRILPAINFASPRPRAPPPVSRGLT